MTVGELITKLMEFDPNLPVATWDYEYDDPHLIEGSVEIGPSTGFAYRSDIAVVIR